MPLRSGDEVLVTDAGNQPRRRERLEGCDHLCRGGVHGLSAAMPWPISDRLYLRLRRCLMPPTGVEVKGPGSLECQQRPPQPVHSYCLFQGRHAASLRSSYLRLLWCPLRAEPPRGPAMHVAVTMKKATVTDATCGCRSRPRDGPWHRALGYRKIGSGRAASPAAASPQPVPCLVLARAAAF